MTNFDVFKFLFCIQLLFQQVYSLTKNDCGQISPQDNSTFPWNVGIYINNNKNNDSLEFLCFGTLIQSNAILTAAHCFSNNFDGSLRNGTFYVDTNNLKKSVDIKSQQLHKVNKNTIFIYKHYKGIINLFSDDLAIIKVKTKFTDKIKPVCIDWENILIDNNVNLKAPVWDRDKIKSIDHEYLDSEDCSYDAPKTFSPFITQDKHCVKNKLVPFQHQEYSRNEGSGLVFLNLEDNLWYMKGVINRREPSQGKVSTFTQISQYMNWISNICATP